MWIWLKLVSNGPIIQKLILEQVVAWCQEGDKPLHAPMTTVFTNTHMSPHRKEFSCLMILYEIKCQKPKIYHVQNYQTYLKSLDHSHAFSTTLFDEQLWHKISKANNPVTPQIIEGQQSSDTTCRLPVMPCYCCVVWPLSCRDSVRDLCQVACGSGRMQGSIMITESPRGTYWQSLNTYRLILYFVLYLLMSQHR